MAELAVLTHVRPWRDVVTIITIALLGFAASPALGATVDEAPTIAPTQGPLTPGTVLTASSGRWTPDDATPVYDWLRCRGDACAPIDGACRTSYRVRTEDVGNTLAVRLTVTDSSDQGATGNSAPTGEVQPTPYKPTVDPLDTCVRVTPTGRQQGTFTSGEQTGGGTVPPPNTSLPFIDPFPVVRIAGRFKGKRTKLTRVLVNAPSAARIRVACKGRGCPYRRKAIAVKLVRVRALQRTYRPKATIEIRVTQPRKIGKYTRVQTQRGKAPLRVDRCLMPGKTRPVKCPTG